MVGGWAQTPSARLPLAPPSPLLPLSCSVSSCGQILPGDGQRRGELRVNRPWPQGWTQETGHYVYIVQTIYLIFIKIKRSLFIPVYVMQSQGAQFSVLPAGEQGRGLPAHTARAMPSCPGDAPVPGRAPRCPAPAPGAGAALPRPARRGGGGRAAARWAPPVRSWPAALGLFIFGLNSRYSADVSGWDLEV